MILVTPDTDFLFLSGAPTLPLTLLDATWILTEEGPPPEEVVVPESTIDLVAPGEVLLALGSEEEAILLLESELPCDVDLSVPGESVFFVEPLPEAIVSVSAMAEEVLFRMDSPGDSLLGLESPGSNTTLATEAPSESVVLEGSCPNDESALVLEASATSDEEMER